MKKVLSILFFVFYQILEAQEKEIAGLDERINHFFETYLGWFAKLVFQSIPLGDGASIPWVVLVLIAGAAFFTIYFKFINITLFSTAIKIVRGFYDKVDHHEAYKNEENEIGLSVDGDILGTIKDESRDGEVSHFQALTTALSATVGLGNIAGVAIALSIGGPGATFWMVIAGLLGMSSKFVECTLGVHYRDINKEGIVYGGPMYYLEKGLGGFIGKALAIVFALFCVAGSFGGGNMFQANQAFKMVEFVTGGDNSPLVGQGWLFGLVLSIFVGIVIIGGIKSIARVTDKMVPFMVILYVGACLVVLFVNYKQIPWAIQQIIDGAFSPQGVAGGVVGVLVQGFKRAAFSNEAGIGSASIAHSAVKTKFPASEGLVSLLEPFIDTVVICTMTALVLVVSGKLVTGSGIDGAKGVELTSEALSTGASWFPWVLTVTVVLFAFSTMVSWSYYGAQAWAFLFGRSKQASFLYKALFCGFVILGSAASMSAVIDFSDAAIFAMMVPNMIGMFVLAPEVKRDLRKYLKAIRYKK